MKYLEFSPPDGPDVRNPKKAFLRDLIFNKGEDYWQCNAGEGGLYASAAPLFEGNALVIAPGTAMLGLTLKEPYGFHVHHAIMGEGEFVAIASKNYSKKVTIYIGGSSWTVPTAFFVSKEDAWKAVESFFRTGKRSRKLTWVKLSEQEW